MKFTRACLISLLMLGGCASSPELGHQCGISHVEPNGTGLKIYIQPGTDWNIFNVNRTGAEGSSMKHSVRKGRLVPPDIPRRNSFHPFAPRYFFLDKGGSASSFQFFGGCTYQIKSDDHGMYLYVDGTDGDTSTDEYFEDIRPEKANH